MPAITEFVDITVSVADAQSAQFGFGSLCGVFDHSVTANRQDGPYASVDEVVAAGFTSVAEPEVHAWASAVFAHDNSVNSVIVGREDSGDANWTATLAAVYADDPTAFYGLTIESRVEADILLAAAFTESAAVPKILIAQTADADVLDGTSGNVAADLMSAGYHRTALVYHRFGTSSAGAITTDGYLDGSWAGRCLGFNLDGPNGVGTWSLKQLTGVTADPITGAEASEIYDANANMYASLNSLSFTSKGTMASGRRIDVQTSLDWLKLRTEEAVLTALVSAPTKIPYTDAGINLIKAVVQSILDQGVSFGHLSPDAPPQWTVPRVSEVSTADKIARVLTMSCVVTLTGAIEKLVLNFTVEQ